jgi:hypothetical protein
MAAKKKASKKAKFPLFSNEAMVMGVAGARLSAATFGGFDRARVHACAELAERWTEKLAIPGSPLVATASGDVLGATSEPWQGELLIGLRAYRARAEDGHAWTGLLLENVRERLERVATLPDECWRAFATTLDPARADELLAALLAEPFGLRLVAQGPLASGFMLYGVPSVAPREGVEFVIGQDEEQTRHSFGIAGVLVAEADGERVADIDVSGPAHEARVAATKHLVGSTIRTGVGDEQAPLGYALLCAYDVS